MKRMIVQLYEIQEPREAERLIELGVDHIGSVILSPDNWKIPAIKDVVRLVRGSPAKSTLIPLMTKEDDILRALDYYQPDFVHFCELIPLAPAERSRREAVCAELIRIQQVVQKEFPPFKIIRSIPIPEPGLKDPAPVREVILEIAGLMDRHTDYFMTDTLRGFVNETAAQPVAGYVGITGEVCDWDLAAALVGASRIPVITGRRHLAGKRLRRRRPGETRGNRQLHADQRPGLERETHPLPERYGSRPASAGRGPKGGRD